MLDLNSKLINNLINDPSIDFRGSKIPEIGYLQNELKDVQLLGKSCLVIGEREAFDGIAQSVSSYKFREITCTDIDYMPEDSNLGKLVAKDKRFSFEKIDFVNWYGIQKFDIQVCISVLEHIGLCPDIFDPSLKIESILTENDDFHWNDDLRALKNMMGLMKDMKSKVIITVPYGGFYDTHDNGMVWQRYYDIQRKRIVKKFVEECGCKLVTDMVVGTRDFQEWQEHEREAEISFNVSAAYQIQKCTPHFFWFFTIMKK